MQIVTDQALGLFSSHSRIEVVANRTLFTMGPLVIRCEANIYTLWSRVVDGHVRDETPLLAPVLGSTSSQSQSNTYGKNIFKKCEGKTKKFRPLINKTKEECKKNKKFLQILWKRNVIIVSWKLYKKNWWNSIEAFWKVRGFKKFYRNFEGSFI